VHIVYKTVSWPCSEEFKNLGMENLMGKEKKKKHTGFPENIWAVDFVDSFNWDDS
jgi:hypothetical protein